LVVCDPESYLLAALDFWPGLQTHLTPDFAVEGLSTWAKSGPRFDLCLVELTNTSSDLLNIIDAAIPRLQHEQGRLLLLWNDRLTRELRPTVTEIMKAITLRQFDFKLDYTVSWKSAVAANLLRQPGIPAFGFLSYPLKWFSFLLGTSLLIVDRLVPSLRSKPLYLTQNCSSLAIELNVHKTSALAVPPVGLMLWNKARLARTPTDIDLYFNIRPEFTNWVVRSNFLQEPFVVIDVGVLGGENPRWHLLREHLVVHGFDAIKEVIEELRRMNQDLKWDRSYHWMAIGNDNGDKEFFFDSVQPTRSSLGFSSGSQRRIVPMRTLDWLIAEGAVPHPDFLKVDVEGQEAGVFLGAKQMLAAGVLGIEVETNFMTSPEYPKSHFDMIHNLVLENGLKLFDLNFDRVVRPLYKEACKKRALGISTAAAGTPGTFNVLFCRDAIAEREGSSSSDHVLPTPTVDQIIKMMITYELYGLSDVAVDTAVQFSKELSTRFEVRGAIERLCK
jgi:FkbM family methyltransferase